MLSVLPDEYEKIKLFLLTSIVSLFRWDKRILKMVQSDNKLFLEYYRLLFGEKNYPILEKLPANLKKVCEDVKERLKARSKVSLIIPIYNGEKYIDRCLKSLLS